MIAPIRLSAVFIATTCLAVTSASAQVVVLTENFTTATQASGGWTLTSGFWPAQNNSDNPQPYATNGGAWGPGGTLLTPAPGGNYFATDTTATGNDNGTVSDWLLTPVLTFHNGDILKFATRTRSPEEGPSRLEIRLSTAGSLTNVGTLPGDVGVFSQLVATINPSLTANTYPTSWAAGTETFTISGLSGTQSGRIAFHTFYTNGGFGGPNGDTVGLATVTYTVSPTITTWTWTGATSGSWNNTGNWSPSGVPSSNIDNQITFGATTHAVMTNDIAGTLVVNSLTFTSAAPVYALTGNGLNFQTNSSAGLPQIVTNSPNGVTISAPLTLTNNLSVSGSGNLTLNGAVGGAGGLTMSGLGTLILGNANTYAGGTNVQNGTVQVAADAALGTGNVSGASLGTVNYTGTTATTRSFTMNGGTVAVAAGQTLTLNGGTVTSAFLDGAGTFATGAATGAQLTNVTSEPSVAIVSNNAADHFLNLNNSAALSVAPGVNSAGTSTTTTLDGFTNQGLGSVTLGAASHLNVANFQSYGTVTVTPASSSPITLLTNFGASPLSFVAGSRTFIGTPATATGPFVAGVDVHGQNITIVGGLFVNNGFVADSLSGGTVIVDAGALYKGAGTSFVPIVTQNGGRVQAGNSPGVMSSDALTIGPGGIQNFRWQINDAGPSPTYPNSGGSAGGFREGPNLNVSGWSLLAARTVINPLTQTLSTGNLTWTAASGPGSQFQFSLETLLGPASAVGTNIEGPMAEFDPTLKYVWPFITYQGTYSGPTDDASLTGNTLIDTSLFQNTLPGTLSLHLDQSNRAMELIYTPTPVPEPGTLGLVAVGLLAVWRCRRGRCR